MEIVYESKAKTTRISATSRASVKVRDSYYTVEYQEERVIPDIESVDLDQEREMLWATVNNECDRQVQEIISTFKK